MTEADAEHPYDRYAEAYRDWWGPILAPSAVRLLDRLDGLLPADRPFTLVDVGTGTGNLVLAALERWPMATASGVDPSVGMMRLARTEARRRGGTLDSRLRLMKGTAEAMPLGTASADLGISSFAIQLASSRSAVARELFRVVRPGGRIGIVTWQEGGDPFVPDDILDETLDELQIEGPEGGDPPLSYPSPAAAATELRRAGFRRVSPRVDWLEHQFTAENFVNVVEHWIEDDLFASLGWTMRRRLRSRLLASLRRLAPAELLWRRPLVSVVALHP